METLADLVGAWMTHPTSVAAAEALAHNVRPLWAGDPRPALDIIHAQLAWWLNESQELTDVLVAIAKGTEASQTRVLRNAVLHGFWIYPATFKLMVAYKVTPRRMAELIPKRCRLLSTVTSDWGRVTIGTAGHVCVGAMWLAQHYHAAGMPLQPDPTIFTPNGALP